jgi:hypothetical protein
MKLLLTTLALLIAATIVGTGKAATETPGNLKPITGTILCPERVPVRQKLITPAKGWDSYADPSTPQTDVYLFYGDPSEEEAIISESGGVKVSSPTAGMWMGCIYGETEIRIARPLAIVSKECRYLSKGKGKNGDPHHIGVHCE